SSPLLRKSASGRFVGRSSVDWNVGKSTPAQARTRGPAFYPKTAGFTQTPGPTFFSGRYPLGSPREIYFCHSTDGTGSASVLPLLRCELQFSLGLFSLSKSGESCGDLAVSAFAAA